MSCQRWCPQQLQFYRIYFGLSQGVPTPKRPLGVKTMRWAMSLTSPRVAFQAYLLCKSWGREAKIFQRIALLYLDLTSEAAHQIPSQNSSSFEWVVWSQLFFLYQKEAWTFYATSQGRRIASLNSWYCSCSVYILNSASTLCRQVLSRSTLWSVKSLVKGL